MKYKYSLAFLALLLITSPFHLTFEQWLVHLTGKVFIEYVLLGFFLAFLVLALYRGINSATVSQIAATLLAGSLLIYWDFNLRVFAHKFHVAEFFLVGLLLDKDNEKRKSLWPFLILCASAFLFELIEKLLPGRVFDFHAIWINAIAGLAGFAMGL